MSEGTDWLVYFLRCVDNSLYCGVTNDIERRLGAHGRGGVKYTRGRLPVEPVYIEAGYDHGGALRCELHYKRMSRAQKEALITQAGVQDCPPRPKTRRRRA